MGWTNPVTWVAAKLFAAELNEQLRDNMAFLKANIALESAVELTIDAGVITKTKAFHKIDTQGDASDDDLDTIDGGTEGDILFLRAEHADRTIILKDGTGNLRLGGSTIYLTNTGQIVALIYDGSDWLPI